MTWPPILVTILGIELVVVAVMVIAMSRWFDRHPKRRP